MRHFWLVIGYFKTNGIPSTKTLKTLLEASLYSFISTMLYIPAQTSNWGGSLVVL